MNVKERLAIPRQKPRELDPEERINNFDEVCKGFDEKTALLEAERCLQCRRPLCVMGCPIGTVMSRLYRGRKILRERLADYAQSAGLAGRTEDH